MDFVAAFNLVEALWWLAMAAVCWRTGRGDRQTVGRTAAAFFVLFAATDLVEIQTGAWWKPWWLAAIKGFCGFGLASCGAWAWRLQRHHGQIAPKKRGGD